MNHDLFSSSIQALLEGRATALQKSMIEEAMLQDEYKELYFKIIEEWEVKNLQLVVDTEQAYAIWSKEIIAANSHNEETMEDVSPKLTTGRQWKYPLVACFFLLLGVAGYLFQQQLLYQEYLTGNQEIKTFYLSDGTRVVLNENSSLLYPRFGFGRAERKVQLKGEGEFAVTHLPNHQRFVVKTVNGLEVKVLGTQFRVVSQEEASKVMLNEGKVELTSQASSLLDRPIVMQPGDVIAITNSGELTWDRNQTIELNKIWKNHRFQFDNTSVSHAAYEIGKVFGVTIQIDDSILARRTIGGTFQADSVDKVLNVLSEMLDIKVIPQSSYSSDKKSTYLLMN